MKRTPPTHGQEIKSTKAFVAAAAALAVAMLALNSADLHAASGTWQANAADQGVGLNIASDGSSWTVTSSPGNTTYSLVEGDAVFVGNSTGVGLGTNFNYYYTVGVGSTPSPTIRFSQSPGAGTFAASAGVTNPLPVIKVPTWFTAGNWASGIVPNGIDDAASITTTSSISSVMLDRDLTLGSLTVNTATCGTNFLPAIVGGNGLSILAASRSGGPLSTLTFKTSTGTPTITLSGGNSLSLSEAKINQLATGNSGAKLTIVGTQGLVIDNQNPFNAPIGITSTGNQTNGTTSTPTFGVGPVRFGFGLDWSKFRGDLTLNQGVFQSLAGGTLNNNLTSLPMHSKVVLGTGNNSARLEIIGSTGQTVFRGLESTSASSSVVNTSILTVPTTGSISLSTVELGSYSLASDTYNFAGNIGDTSSGIASAPAIRLIKVGPGTQILSGVNNLNAPQANSVLVAVNGGKLSLGTTGAIGVITGGQGAANTDSSFLLKNGEFALSGLGNSTGARSQAFGGKLLVGSIAANTSTPDNNQSQQSNSFSKLTVTADPAQPATLTFGSLSPRNFFAGVNGNLNGVTMLYRGTNLGATPGPGVATINFTTAPTVGGGSLSTTGTLGTTTAPVLKGALADATPTGTGTGFATYDVTNGVRLLSGAEQNVVTTGAAYDAVATTNENIVLDLSANDTITGHASSTLKINNSSNSTLTLTNNGTALNAANGLLFSGTAPIVLSGGQITGTVDTAGEDVVIHSINTSTAGITLQTPVSNACTTVGSSARQGWVTYSGPGNLRLEGAQTVGVVGNSTVNTVGGIAFNSTGTTTLAASVANAATLQVNQGVVKLDTGASWTNTPRLILAPEGKFDLNGIGGNATTNRYIDISPSVLASGLTVNPIAGEVTNSSATTADLVLSTGTSVTSFGAFFGTITGNLNLIVDKANFNSGTGAFTYATQILGNANTYTGSTQIRAGVLSLVRGALLPATTKVYLGNYFANSIAGNSTLSANSTLSLGDTNGSTNGSIRQEIAGLYASGTGTAAVINGSSVLSQLTLNIATGVDDIYAGNLGVTPTANGANSNLFGLRKIGAGTFEASGNVTAYSGGTIIQGGILRVSSDAKLGQIGSLSGAAGSAGAALAPMSAFANSIILDGGTLQTTTNATFVLDSKRGIGLGPVDGSTGGNGTLWVDSGITLTYGGVIASAGNTGSQTLVKDGAGLLVLTGNSTFTGVTNVAGGTLGGNGTLASGLAIASGAAVAPGVGGLGTLTFNGGLTLSNGAILNLELDAPGVSDKIQLGGAVSATGTTTLNLAGLAGFAPGVYSLISSNSTIDTSKFVVGSVPAGHYGTLSSGNGTLSVTMIFGTPPPSLTAIESWRNTNFGSSTNTGDAADTFDKDADGVVNLIEYATGSNPLVAGTAAYSTAMAGNFLALTYTRIADTTLTYTVESSSDLVTWSTVATANNPSTGAANVSGAVTVTDTVTASPGRRFLRLKVSH